MTWPEVLPVVTAAVGVALAFFALVRGVGRFFFRPWMREVARMEADRVRAEVKALADKLATNDFPHLEHRIERRLAEAREDRKTMRAELEAMEGRTSERLDEVGRLIRSALPTAPEARGEERRLAREPFRRAPGPRDRTKVPDPALRDSRTVVVTKDKAHALKLGRASMILTAIAMALSLIALIVYLT